MKFTPRHGRQMLRAALFVASNPGCAKIDVARHISPHPIPCRNWSLGYEPVDRAIRAGLIRAERGRGNTYRLYAAE
jgi:hypothetical protein